VSSSEAVPAPGRDDILRIVAPNPGPMTLEGTNTYLVGSDPVWVVDPGPADEGHVEAIRAEAEQRGGIGAIVVTHGHLDHNGAVPMLDAEVIWGGKGSVDEATQLAAASSAASGPRADPVRGSHAAEESEAGPFHVVPTPGHANDHVVFARGDVVFCGDLILGSGSSIVPPKSAGGSLADYLRSLDRLEELGAALLCPGHGPWITDPAAKITEYREHRLDRERMLLAALESGERSRAALLEAAWSDVPESMRPAAALAMQANLEKLAGEGMRLNDLEP
jgi:glyoxylase-like metal-dependent hydrolase (beta-lactamase superfamily II)